MKEGFPALFPSLVHNQRLYLSSVSLDAFISLLISIQRYTLNLFSVLNSRSYIDGLYVPWSLITTILRLYSWVA